VKPLGHCTAGGAYVPTLSDYSIIVRGTGGVFLGGPPLVKAATGEDISADELGGADVHTRISGTADYAVDSEAEGIALAREIVGTFRRQAKAAHDAREPEPPFYDSEELYGIIPDDVKKQFDMREVSARIVDGSLFHEFARSRQHAGGQSGPAAGRHSRQQWRIAPLSGESHPVGVATARPLFMHNITAFMMGPSITASPSDCAC
jgi:hypothetical protein